MWLVPDGRFIYILQDFSISIVRLCLNLYNSFEKKYPTQSSMSKEQIHHERKNFKVVLSCLILVYKKVKEDHAPPILERKVW